MRIQKWSRRRFAFYLLLNSSIFAMIVIHFNIPSDEFMVSYSWARIDLLESFMETIRSGHIPNFLSAYEHSYGYAMYLPYLGVCLGQEYGWKLLLDIQLGAMFILMVILPFEIYLCFKNRIVAFLTPLLSHVFLGNVLYGLKTDSFWGMAWVTVLATPLLFYIAVNVWNRNSYLIVGLIGVLCSLSNVMRNHNGFFPLIMFFLILLHKVIWQKENILKIICIFILFLFLYESISTIIPLLFGIILNLPTLNNGAFVWHALLAGLGYNYPNIYGLEWSDSKVAEVVKTYYNYSEYATDEYASACRALFFRICKESPLFVIETYIKKMLKMLRYSLEFTLTPISKTWLYWNTGKFMVHNLTVPIGLTALSLLFYKRIFNNIRTHIKKYSIFIIFSVSGIFIGTLEAVIALPDIKYGLTSITSLCMTFFYIALIILNTLCSEKRAGKESAYETE